MVLAAQLMCEVARRLRRGGHHVPSRLHMTVAWDEAAYALDAPERIPAGSCIGEQIDDIGPITMQTYVDRP